MKKSPPPPHSGGLGAQFKVIGGVGCAGELSLKKRSNLNRREKDAVVARTCATTRSGA